MKATISADGVIALTAETSLEAFALRHWVGTNLDGTHWLASGLMVIAEDPDAKEQREHVREAFGRVGPR